MAEKKTPKAPSGGPEAKAVAKAERDHDRAIARMVNERGMVGSGVSRTILEWLVGKDRAGDVADELVASLIRDLAPTNALERMMVEQLAVLHVQALDLNRMAKQAESYANKEVTVAMAARMLGEFRKTMLALKEWRAPARSFIVAQQANVAQNQIVHQANVGAATPPNGPPHELPKNPATDDQTGK